MNLSAHESGAVESADVARLTRWIDSGGTWTIVARRPDWVSVSLRRCDGGEEADRFTSDDPALLEMVEDEPVSD